MAQYVIEHGMVDMHRRGERVDFSDSDIDLERLLDLGAIREATKDDEGPQVAYGTPSDLAASPIPTIPPPSVTTGAEVVTTAERVPDVPGADVAAAEKPKK